MEYSRIAEAIPASPIRKMMVKAAAMEDSISFAVGEPDFKPVDEVFEAAKASLDARESAYAPGAGLEELREVYVEYLSKVTGVPYRTEETIVTVGGMGALFLGLLSLLNEGDEVLVSAPYFSNYRQMIEMCHGVTVPVDVHEEDEFILTPGAVEKALTPKSKVLMINSPCNPTGGIISEEATRKLAEIAIKNDLFVISDEVYRHIIFDGLKYFSIASVPGMKERTLIVDSCSKTFAMPGFRVGFGSGPKELIALMIKLTEGVYSAVPNTPQRGAIAAIRYCLPYCETMVAQYQKRRDYIYEKINQMPGLSCIKPKGAFYVFVNLEKTGLRAEEFAERLMDEEHVAVVPGSNFGSVKGSSYFRISYATSMENIVEGMDRMERFCKRIAAGK